MSRPRRSLQTTVEQTLSPPAALSPHQQIARIVQAAGKNLYHVETAVGDNALVEMPARFRSTIWVKRGSYVVIDEMALQDRDNKLGGEIINIVRDEKLWRKQGYWPPEFAKKSDPALEMDDEDESNVAKMPPSSEDED